MVVKFRNRLACANADGGACGRCVILSTPRIGPAVACASLFDFGFGLGRSVTFSMAFVVLARAEKGGGYLLITFPPPEPLIVQLALLYTESNSTLPTLPPYRKFTIINCPKMSNPKPTIALIHGAWQSPSVWTFVTPLLEKAGYSVYPIPLKSPGMVPASPDFSCDVDVIGSGIEAILDTGKDVVVVMHSYAAVVGCEALKRFHGEMWGCESGGNGMENDCADAGAGTSKRDLGAKLKFKTVGGNGERDMETAKFIPRRGRILHLAFIAGMVVPVGRALWTPDRTELKGFELKDELIRTLDGATRFYIDLPAPARESGPAS
ncbi:hypothetical protein PABG_12491 [Paracoccidioides brasiliensis Pb03]|nr:hypothetical protein PABG_12491 [Paracoccidioides brasiliensis Pb03]